MKVKVLAPAFVALLVVAPLATVKVRAQKMEGQLGVDHSECTFFGAKRDTYARLALQAIGAPVKESAVSQRTRAVANSLARGSEVATKSFSSAPAADSIDSYILADLQANNIAPADKTNDYEFIRRASLDLTGRIPTPDRVTAFVNDSSANKRAALIDELLAAPEWVDKWTMFYGDLYQNNASNLQIQRRAEGRNAFYKYIHDSLAANKPYDQMASEIIGAHGNNSFDQANGQINWLIGGVVTGGPAQDIFDQQTANMAEQFMGISHVNCLLCHNGRGHLDTLSLWASKTTRTQAEQLSAFMAKTWVRNIKIVDPNNPTNNNLYYWSLDKYTTDYNLNTTTGNRPARQPVGTTKTLTPAYLFNGSATPKAGDDYRTVLAGLVTADPQFARAAVNYIWAQMFQRGIVDPPDQFDLARLDPANPPPAPWTLQPSNPALLNALATHFTASGFDLKALMREIANSETYQLSSRYNGDWNPANEKFFARKLVRRLWSEEIHDAIAQATGMIPSYNVNGFSKDSTTYGVVSPGFGPVSWAMKLPETVNMPDGGTVGQFLDSFLRGDRDSNPRKEEGSIIQALSLLNDPFIEQRLGSGLVAKSLPLPDNQLIDTLFMTVLSRHPTSDETATAMAKLRAGSSGLRGQNTGDLLWGLFNKVDFIFNY